MTIINFVLLMLLFPEAQRSAQEELDLTVGRDRLPEMADKPAMPYINALIKEVLRWDSTAWVALPRNYSSPVISAT